MLGTLPDGFSSGLNESGKQWVRPVGSGLKLGMILDSNHERMTTDFSRFNQIAVWRDSTDDESRVFQGLPIGVIELEAVPMSFIHYSVAVCGLCEGVFKRLTWI